MKFDRTTVLGFVVMGLLLFGYLYYNSKQQSALQKQKDLETAQKAHADSLARLNPKDDSTRKVIDSTIKNNREVAIHGLDTGTEKITTVKTELFTIAFTTKGGQPKWIELNKFKNKDSGLVRLSASSYDRISYPVKMGSQNAETGELYFRDPVVTQNGDSTIIAFNLTSDSISQPTITHQFVVKKDDYMVDFNIHVNDAGQLLTQGKINLSWQYEAAQQESGISFEKTNTQVGYVENGEFDYHTIGRRDTVTLDGPVKWVGIRQRFFNSFLIAKDNFSSGAMGWTIPPDNQHVIVQAKSDLQIPVPASGNVALSLFYGPADYHILKKYDIKLSKVINLGQGMYAFVSPLNRYVILPVWDFIKGIVSNYGIVIALLTLFIRLLISPLTYKSYLSGAKMKALRPEIAKLKEKHGNDQQAMSMDQMKLFREAGVNPLGGCIPALFQIPIFFALYSFFSASVDLRGADFLWAKDLSAFDDVIHFGVNIPLLGSHLSLFTITAVLTSLLISLYSMSMTPDQSNPVLKYMPYIFPVFLLFIFNGLPSALTWYYTVSNIITLILQYVIQNYIIDHDKILAKIEENRKKPKTKSKWQERVEQMQEQQKKMKEIQQKGKR
ncbi:MAG TPA: membrane protein insertase YidC [Chitinophagaceae bacterium]|nr:membrane protein insertase YidC [Chitinophagaceae bacterium]